MHDGSEATTVSQLLTRLQGVTDDELVSEVERLARCERDATARLVAHLAELDARRLHLGAGFSSLFAYLHGRAPALRARGLQPHRGGAGGEALPGHPGAVGRGSRQPHRDPAAGTPG